MLFSVRLCYSDRNDPSHYQSASRPQVSLFSTSHFCTLTSSNSVITELIIGYMLPGRPVAMMLFKTWGYITMAQALGFSSDFKLGHYMKIPPRAMFWAQVICTIISGTVQLGVQEWMFTNIPDICSPTQRDGFICPSTEVFGTASIIWGVIGPAHQFSKGQLYYPLLLFFLVGFLCPFIGWLLAKRFPDSWARYLNFPVIFSGVGNIPPATAVNYVTWGIVGFIFQYVIRRRHFSWWTKYNCQPPVFIFFLCPY
jgi:OPT family oligopeptide transporter